MGDVNGLTEVGVRHCVVVRTGNYRGAQGAHYSCGLSRRTASMETLSVHRLLIHAGEHEPAHEHDYETGLVLISGSCTVYWGQQLEHRTSLWVGDHFAIPPHVPHLPVALTDCDIVLARSVPDQDPGIRLLPELEALYMSMAYRP